MMSHINVNMRIPPQVLEIEDDGDGKYHLSRLHHLPPQISIRGQHSASKILTNFRGDNEALNKNLCLEEKL